MKALIPQVPGKKTRINPPGSALGEPRKAALGPPRTDADRRYSKSQRVPAYAPLGYFCWPELVTTDIEAAKLFYAALFKWEAEDLTMPTGSYTLFKVKGLTVAGASQKGPEQGEAHWTVSVAVKDANASAKKVVALGGKLLAGPLDFQSLGRKAFAQDPGGAPFGLWQSGSHFGAGLFGSLNALGWTGLQTWDVKEADGFYRGLFDWEPEPEGEQRLTHEIWWLNNARVGGMRAMPGPFRHDQPSQWVNHFVVASCTATARRARAAGGELLSGPTEIPEVGMCSMLRDPAGAVFAIIQLPKG